MLSEVLKDNTNNTKSEVRLRLKQINHLLFGLFKVVQDKNWI